MKCIDLHRKFMFLTLHGVEVGETCTNKYSLQKLNEMSRSAQKIMFLILNPMGAGVKYQKYFC